MKLLAFLVAAQLTAALPQAPAKQPLKPEVVKTPPQQTTAEDATKSPEPKLASIPQGKTTTPAGCRKVDTDVDWPAAAEWTKVLPEIAPRAKNLAKGVYRPDYKVQAESVKDVQTAVKFAAQNNIRLTLITTGHDFLGRNDAASGLSLDASLLAGITVHDNWEATTTGTPRPGKTANIIVPVPGKQAAVTFGVGMTTQRINDALNPSKLVTVGAAHGSVAPAGGYGQTSGHSPISNLYGLGSDQFLEFKVVTADGELKVANKLVNSDLFWALRGGGGSTFGVVVQATMKAHPDIPITLANWSVNTTIKDGDGLWDAYAYLHTKFVDLADNKGVTAYYYAYPTRIQSTILHTANHSGKTNAEAVWKPILEKMSSFANMTKPTLEITEYPTFKAYFDARFGAIDKPMGSAKEAPRTNPWDAPPRRSLRNDLHMLYPRHGPGEEMKSPEPSAIANLDSRLLGAEHFAHPELARILRDAAPWRKQLNNSQAVIQGHLIGGGKVLKPDDDTSVLPAWRKTYVHLIGFNSPGLASVDSLRKLAPDMGAYANEAYPLNPDWKKTFWGSNYPKLSQIKTKYDPENLFWASPGINADHMEARNGRACKVANIVEHSMAPLTDNLNNGRVMTGSIN
ncbi:FAD-binding domain-containing protein [Tothia fuscella]|uniref:FAD-binding domain-containing protein n=1 Tax=Tothia fuscella TaxID=1048955 RepID=A0A9P4TWS3_9PEZI|nr:FAD-binding domain-containing protein [Tothia fuscella]